MRRLAASVLAALLTLAAAVPLNAQRFESPAPFAFVKDLTTGAVLMDRASDEPMPPASMGKMMTVLVAFDLIDRGELALDQTFRVRPETWEKWHSAGSTMFLSANQEVSVENLLHGIVTASGNDATVVLAEGIAGTEAAFADLMNQKGQQIGLTGSNFETSNGWPHENEYVTPRDLAVIAERTIVDHPSLYERFYGVPEFTWGETMGGEPITQPNRNPILGRVEGADGLKTGHTEAAGYGFTGSAEQNGRRIVIVVSGLTSTSERTAESTRMMGWAFNAFEAKPLLAGGKIVAEIPVQGGSDDRVGATAANGQKVTLPRAIVSNIETRIVYDSPVPAPIARGDRVATLVVKAGDIPEQHIPLVAAADVGEAGFFGRAFAGFKSLFD